MNPRLQALHNDCKQMDQQHKSQQLLASLRDIILVDDPASGWRYCDRAPVTYASGSSSEPNEAEALAVVQIEVWRAQANRNRQEFEEALSILDTMEQFLHRRRFIASTYLADEIQGLQAACYKGTYLLGLLDGDPLNHAIQRYRAAWARPTGTKSVQRPVWHGVNAATLMLCNGETLAAQHLFAEVLFELGQHGHTHESGSWESLSAIECLLGLQTPAPVLVGRLQRLELTEKERTSFRNQLASVWPLACIHHPAMNSGRVALLHALQAPRSNQSL